MTELANLDVASANGVVVATLSGEIDLSNAAQITRAVVGGVPNEAVGLVMDLSDVAYLDSAGVRMLAELERRLGWRSQCSGSSRRTAHAPGRCCRSPVWTGCSS